MGEFRSDCCEPQRDCCDRPQHCCEPRCCDNDGGGIWGILILLFVSYLLFCNNNDRGGGLFGGLF